MKDSFKILEKAEKKPVETMEVLPIRSPEEQMKHYKTIEDRVIKINKHWEKYDDLYDKTVAYHARFSGLLNNMITHIKSRPSNLDPSFITTYRKFFGIRLLPDYAFREEDVDLNIERHHKNIEKCYDQASDRYLRYVELMDEQQDALEERFIDFDTLFGNEWNDVIFNYNVLIDACKNNSSSRKKRRDYCVQKQIDLDTKYMDLIKTFDDYEKRR